MYDAAARAHADMWINAQAATKKQSFSYNTHTHILKSIAETY